ncbi:MAG: NEW3 domain-containing protein, partial [Actinobacteria bacterium]|nr:NEW3 domain-containing protein [Actinomycetota bacterium]
EITGNFALALVTPDERLNVDVTAGRPTEMTLTVFNEGTAPLTEVRLTGIPPSGWEILFAPEVIDVIEPGAAVDVVATITPSGEAINGDYLVTVRASVAETNDTVDIRATVETSPIWGLVGIGVIVVALGVLVAVFRRFGRR